MSESESESDRRRIGEGWESYRAGVVPFDAPAVQVRETRKAFYAGAWAALNLLLELGRDSLSEDEGARALEALHEECRAFSADPGNLR